MSRSDKPKKQHPSRREFMQKALGLGAVGAVGLGGLHVPRLARAMTGERKHFISLVARGGWDSYLGHQAMLTSHLNGMQIDDYSSLREGSSLTRRFREEDISRVDDPKGGARYMGPLWKDARMGDVFNRMAIWRGLVTEGGHGDGNQLLHHGVLSNYAASYAAIIAKDLALDYVRPLHYVQTTNTTDDVYMGSGLITSSYGIATHIPTMDNWISLTSKSAVEDNYRRAFISSAIEKLSSTSITEALTAPGLAAYTSFHNSYKGSMNIRGTNYANSSEFKALVAGYRAAASDALTRVKSANRYPDMANMNIESVLNSNANLFFSYALSEFLVAKDLSAVVVVPTPTGDHHDLDDNHYVNMCLTYTCLRQLILNLQDTADVSRSGKSMLDCTTICLETEFDRTYNCSWLSSSNRARPGTNHGSSTSVIFAGARIPGGRIIGDVKTGASGLYSSFIDEPFANPLPLDPVSGLPSKDGIFVSQRALLPTLLAMFGIQIPSEQISDQQAVAALLRC